MKEVILNDTHPGNHNDKIKVIICKYVQKDSDFTDEGLTGVRKTNEYCKGMFDEDTDPIQDIIYEDGEYHFTMSNITTISREQVDQLLKDGDKITVMPLYMGG